MAIIRFQKNIKKDPETIFHFLSEQNLLMQWFAPQAIAFPLEGTVAAFSFGSEINFKMKITKLTKFESIKWLCVDGNVDWIDSKVSFSIKIIDENNCKVFFQQSNINNEEKYVQWKSSWKTYLQMLKEKCETFN